VMDNDAGSSCEQAYILRLPEKYAAEVRKRLRDPVPNIYGLQYMMNQQRGNFKGRTGQFMYTLGDDSVNLPLTQMVIF
jgi:hypothetical protein